MTAGAPKKPSYGEMRDKIEPKDIKDRPALATIATAELRDLAPAGSRREDNKIVLSFHEFEGKEYIANATSYKTLCAKLRTNYDKWPGQVCVLAPTTNTFEGQTFTKVHIAAPEVWDRAIEALAKAKAAAPTRKTTK
jgi:hypothetical protein